ncbi:hypothetical protein RMATCC62417_13306 [Rhizopus microsporus]|nr:hypothetical protein RMATCC62417_13306 [Rhizopus microsporus]
MDLDNLPPLTRLPTTFFPSPPKTFDGQESRVVAIAYDYSNYGDAMIAKSIHSDLLRPSDDIRILYVMNQNDYHNLFTPMLTVYGTNGNYDDSQDAYLRNAVDTFMWEIITVLNKRGFHNVSSEILRGDPKEVIIDYCRAVKPVYLLAGTRGLGAVKRAVLGSVSNYLVKHCPSPVLVIKLSCKEIEARKELNRKKQDTFTEVLAKFDYPQPI